MLQPLEVTPPLSVRVILKRQSVKELYREPLEISNILILKLFNSNDTQLKLVFIHSK